MLGLKSLRDTKLIGYYSRKIAVPRNQISPAYQKSDVEIAREDPFSVLSNAQKEKMMQARESMKHELHHAAVDELQKKKVQAAQKRKTKRQKNIQNVFSPIGASATNYQDFFVNDRSSLGTLDISLTNESCKMLENTTPAARTSLKASPDSKLPHLILNDDSILMQPVTIDDLGNQ